MPALILGIALIVIAIMGNANNLLTLMKGQKAFLPWLIAVFILWIIWNKTPSEYQRPVHGLIFASILGIIIVNFSKVQGYITTAETAIKTL